LWLIFTFFGFSALLCAMGHTSLNHLNHKIIIDREYINPEDQRKGERILLMQIEMFRTTSENGSALPGFVFPGFVFCGWQEFFRRINQIGINGSNAPWPGARSSSQILTTV